MMDCYFGCDFDDLVVPKDQESSDTFPSPDNWSRWGISAPEGPLTPDKCFVMDGYMTPSSGFRCLYEEAETRRSDQSNDLNVCGGFFDVSSLQEAPRPAFPLQDFNGIEQMDDIYLNSLLDDLPGNTYVPEPFRASSPGTTNGLKLQDNFLLNISLDSQNISDNSFNKLDGSAFLRTHAFSPSVGWDNEEASVPFICNLEQVESTPLKGQKPTLNISDPPEENSSEESSLEESVLQDFQTVMEKLTNKTRICFRDTFFRLAKNAEQKSVLQSITADAAMETPRWTGQDEKLRSGRKRVAESQTNNIDRAIANLTFNKMDSNEREFPLTASSVNLNRGIRSQNHRSCKQRLHHLPLSPNVPSVAEVPVLFQKTRT